MAARRRSLSAYSLGGDGRCLPVLPGVSDGSTVAVPESQRRSRRRSRLSVLYVPPVLLLHGLAQGTWDRQVDS